jgi:hypothetical protein
VYHSPYGGRIFKGYGLIELREAKPLQCFTNFLIFTDAAPNKGDFDCIRHDSGNLSDGLLLEIFEGLAPALSDLLWTAQ